MSTALDGVLPRFRVDVLSHRPAPRVCALVGETADAVTFFIGSILFTAGGALQSWLAWRERRTADGGRAGGPRSSVSRHAVRGVS